MLEEGVKNNKMNKNLKKQAEIKAKDFLSSILQKKNIDIHNDSQWPQEADILLDSIQVSDNELFRLYFWQELLKLFKKIEKKNRQFYHKGSHYWRMGFILLHRNDFKGALRNFRLSKNEDKIRNKNQFTASKGVVYLLEPLYKNQARSSTLNCLSSLTDQEMRNFAETFNSNHNNAAKQSFTLINGSSTQYKFIKRPRIRKLFKERYEEIKNLYFAKPLNSNYGALFVIGSLLECMIDDLFTRNKERLWIECKKHLKVNSKYGGTLGPKIENVKKICQTNYAPFPKELIPWMIMILEYRNLTHPNKEYNNNIYSPNWYVCAMLFSSLATIAGYLWPSNK